LLKCDADADDAFQATFLALIRSAKKIRKSEHLGPWLHGVAYRVCRNARRASAKRARREQAAVVPEASQPIADKAWDETLAAVHEEVNQLPESLRVAFVLCYLQGKSTSGAAAELGLKLGTFSARLSRAKKAVLDALAKRGCTAVAVAASMTGVAASAPPGLANRAVNLAVSNTAVPANLLALTQGVTQMGVSKFKILAAALVLASLLASSFGVWSAKAQGPGGGPPGDPAAGPAGSAPGALPGEGTPGQGPGGFPGAGPVAGMGGIPRSGGFQPSTAFEYKVVELVSKAESAERELNRLGEQGWELITVTTHPAGGSREVETAYLKRRKAATPGGGAPGFPGRPGNGRRGGAPGLPGTGSGGATGAGEAPRTPGVGGGGAGGVGGAPATPGAFGGAAGGPGVTGASAPTKNANLVRSRVTVKEVSKSWIASDQGALYAIDANTRIIKRGMPAEMSDLKPGTAIEIFFDKDAKVVAEVVIQ
jgi:RNA polymerase sigma factor (sigma-70 family)